MSGCEYVEIPSVRSIYTGMLHAADRHVPKTGPVSSLCGRTRHRRYHTSKTRPALIVCKACRELLPPMALETHDLIAIMVEIDRQEELGVPSKVVDRWRTWAIANKRT